MSFTTNDGDRNLHHVGNLPAHDKAGACLHLAALAALVGTARRLKRKLWQGCRS
jgi:hypothetical protein